MRKPVIGITSTFGTLEGDKEKGRRVYLYRDYTDCVIAAGGVPCVIPPNSDPAAVAQVLDGWLIPGGGDIDASYYGQSNHPKSSHEQKVRIDFELGLFKAMNPDMPVFGICYGCQFINVARGGSLIQHVPDIVGNEKHSGGTLQQYEVAPVSLLQEIVKATEVEGKSYHHQAVDALGDLLAVSARHEDGIIEAIEDVSGKWLLGVQWHPERTPESVASRNLFDRFVQKAAEHAKVK